MQIRKSPVLALFLLALLAPGCNGDSPVNSLGDDALSADTMASIALEIDGIADGIVSSEAGALGNDGTDSTVTTEISFSRTRSCPLGGELKIEGMLRRVADRDTRTVETHFTGTRSMTDCAFSRGDFVVTVNGSTTVESLRRRVEGEFDGPQTTTITGSWHVVRSDGEERTCDISIEIVRDPDAQTITLSGTICGERVQRSGPWHAGG